MSINSIFLRAAAATALIAVSPGPARPAEDLQPASTIAESAGLPANIKQIIHHGRILARPAVQPEGTTREIAYELGFCHQLDRDHCLVVASMDEQGGGDLCVGNDGFIIQKLGDVATAKAIPLNRAVKDFTLAPGAEKVFLAKYPAVGAFVPLGALLPNGQPHPAAGTGLLFSCASTFRADKTTQDETSKRLVEVMQLRWDGSQLKIGHREVVAKLLDLELTGSTPIASCPQDSGWLFPFGTVDGGVVVYRFDWDGQQWSPTRHSKRFTKQITEMESSVRQHGDAFFVQTRCPSAEGNLYRAGSDLDFKFVATLDTRCGSPKILNRGLDGSLYVACNSSPGWVRNPLEMVPWEQDSFGQPVILHDQDGIRGDKGSSKPFVDHAIASNVFLEGRWRHLVFYRVCDLMERTLHGFQLKQGFGDLVYGKGKGPIPRRPWSGMYVVEIVYNHVIEPPFTFVN
jgi:hypothetical protein